MTYAPIYDDEYHGPRWRYGMKYRPLGYASMPKGWIIFSDLPSNDPRCKWFGTVDYPFPLDADLISQMHLVDFGMVDDGSSDEYPNLTAQLLKPAD